MREFIGFLNRQRIHVGAQPDRALRFPMAQRADDAGAAEATCHLEPPFGQLLGNDVAGARFFKAQLRMSVNIASDLLNFGAELDDAIDQLHGLASAY